MAQPRLKAPVRCAVVGYGGAFNMGHAHANWLNELPGFELKAIMDIDPTRKAAANENFPQATFYSSLTRMLNKEPLGLISVVTPHNTHAPVVIKCLEAGVNVVVEKPMCINVKEATAMIEAARKNKVMLTVFHNRRLDGDWMTMKEMIGKGLIGDVFRIEAYMGGFGRPGGWWRSNKKISGGALYDWGAHFVDWVLNLVDSPIQNVTGFFYKLRWHNVTNEDDTEAIVRFKNGTVASIQQSSLSRIGKPRWRILGTHGAVLNDGGDHIHVYSEVKGLNCEAQVRCQKTDWNQWYAKLADTLLRGKPLFVTPESARRVIGVIEYAERSSKSGKAETVPYEE
jgi:scyllo-inositol 2-dehydrogenase (NADP+)